MIKNTPPIHDQYTDRSGSVLVKIASTILDANTRKRAVDTLFNLPDRLSKTASRAYFSTETPEDTFLSRLYFEGQKGQMKTAEAQAIDKNLSTYEALYGLMRPLFKSARLKKTASAQTVELMPGVEVSTYEEVTKVAEAFGDQYQNLNFADRKKLAHNLTKVAGTACDFDDHVCIYAGSNIELRPDAKEQLGFRKAACIRSGQDGSDYEKIASMLDQVDTASLSDGELSKLADTVHSLDMRHGFTDPKYDRRMPDAWHALLKKAERVSTNNDSSLSDKPKEALSKSDIIARYGEQALEAVEDENGNIDKDRLKRIMGLMGDNSSDGEGHDTSTDDDKK